jgi:hypothetical protein
MKVVDPGHLYELSWLDGRYPTFEDIEVAVTCTKCGHVDCEGECR